VAEFKPGIDSPQRKSLAAQFLERANEPQAPRLPVTRNQLVSLDGNVGELGGIDAPAAAVPGIFMNYIPDLFTTGKDGGNTTVPVPPALLLAALGLGLAGAAKRLGWGDKTAVDQ
jgi:hypothetical protein